MKIRTLAATATTFAAILVSAAPAVAGTYKSCEHSSAGTMIVENASCATGWKLIDRSLAHAAQTGGTFSRFHTTVHGARFTCRMRFLNHHRQQNITCVTARSGMDATINL